jgi:ABC-type branched-subunit amino acid transport system ATPase component
MSNAASAVLEVSNLSKSFGGIAAVDGVSFNVREGEILGRMARANRRCSIASSAN